MNAAFAYAHWDLLDVLDKHHASWTPPQKKLDHALY